MEILLKAIFFSFFFLVTKVKACDMIGCDEERFADAEEKKNK